MADSLSLASVLQLAGLGGVIAAFANQLFKWAVDTFADGRKKQSDAIYAAMRISVIMERYVLQSEAHVSDREVKHQMGLISEAGKLPALDSFPADINWRALNTDLAFDALGFPARIEAAQADCIRADWESEDFWLSEGEATKLGLAAWNLAVAIRLRYGFGANQEVHDVALLLSDRAIEKAKRAGAAKARALNAKLEAQLSNLGRTGSEEN